MRTFLNILLGLATVIIVVSLINLGIKAFHPEPERPEFPSKARIGFPLREFNCDVNDTECVLERGLSFEEEKEAKIAQEKYDLEYAAFQELEKEYNKDFFIIANIVGLIVFILGFLVLFKTAFASQGVMVGVMMSGLIAVIEGYARGWNSTNDQLKFFVGLVIAIVIIGGSTWLMQKFARRKIVND